MKKFWKKGMSFESYIDRIQSKIEIQESNELADKQLLTIQRAHHIMENYIPDLRQQKKLEEKNFQGKILIIAEDWCGDCSQVTPVIKKFFQDKNPLKILYRDENPDLMRLFLTNGNEAIPIVIFLDENFNLISHWGPRTRHGLELLAKFKHDPDQYPRSVFLKDLQAYYERNRGFDIVEEILEIL